MTGELTNHVWQSTLFAVAAGLLTVAFRKNRAKVRYGLWFSASIKFLVPFSLLVSLGSHLQWAPAAHKIATQIGAPAVSFTMVRITRPFPPATPVRSTRGNPDWVPIAAFGVWVCGFAGVALMRFRGWRRIRAAVRASVPMEIAAAIEVRSSPGLLEPGRGGLAAARSCCCPRASRNASRRRNWKRCWRTSCATRGDATTCSPEFTCWPRRCTGFIRWCGGSERSWWTSASVRATKKCCAWAASRAYTPKPYSMSASSTWNRRWAACPE